jgi:hypothetical protein
MATGTVTEVQRNAGQPPGRPRSYFADSRDRPGVQGTFCWLMRMRRAPAEGDRPGPVVIFAGYQLLPL